MKTVNVAIACYTTSNAHLELFKYLKALENQVLYFDPNSIAFVIKYELSEISNR